jgi:hypothetical protein
MSSSPRAAAIETLASQLADILSAQISELREFARSTVAGEGTIQLEKNLRSLELRRLELYLQFEEAVFGLPSAPAVAPNELELPEDN